MFIEKETACVTELVYCGRLLRDQYALDHYGVRYGATVFVLKKTSEAKAEPMVTTDVMKRGLLLKEGPLPKNTLPLCCIEYIILAGAEESVVNELITTLQKQMKRPDIRQALENLLTTGDITKKLNNISEIQNDPVALAILREPSVLSVIADTPENIRKAAEAHPGLVKAVKQIMEMASKDAVNYRLIGGMEAEEEALTAFPTRSRPRQQNQSPAGQITASQLTAALAAASASPGVGAGGSPSSSSATLSDQAASNDQMRRLLQSHASQQAAMSSQSFDQQVQTLRGMGIVDETLARRALQHTGGNIEAALDFIFGDSSV